jgi:hypothetical protein
MHRFEVGQLYNPRIRRWPEGMEYAYRGGHHELVLFWESPPAGEIEAVRKGRLDLSVLESGPVILVLFRIAGACDWSEAPFSWHRVPLGQRVSPPTPSREERALLEIFLVDATTGLLQAIRVVTLTPGQTSYLHGAIQRQAVYDAEPPTYDKELDRLRSYTPRELAQRGEQGRPADTVH